MWSPAGGWWCNPKHADRNTMYAFGAVGVAALGTWVFSAANEVRPMRTSALSPPATPPNALHVRTTPPTCGRRSRVWAVVWLTAVGFGAAAADAAGAAHSVAAVVLLREGGRPELGGGMEFTLDSRRLSKAAVTSPGKLHGGSAIGRRRRSGVAVVSRKLQIEQRLTGGSALHGGMC